MKHNNLEKYGIKEATVQWNLSPEELQKETIRLKRNGKRN